jgi:hypothetical protein
LGWFATAAIALVLGHESLDSTNMCVEARTELKRCVLGRIGPANRQARPLAGRASLLASSRAFNPPKLCCAGKPDPLQQPPHSTVGNIVLSAT